MGENVGFLNFSWIVENVKHYIFILSQNVPLLDTTYKQSRSSISSFGTYLKANIFIL